MLWNKGQGAVGQLATGEIAVRPTIIAEVVQIIEENHGNVIGKQPPDQK